MQPNAKQPEHTLEPWVAKEGPHVDSPSDWFIVTEAGVTIALMVGAPHANWKANARRIVACVNKCRGFSTEDLESEEWQLDLQHQDNRY